METLSLNIQAGGEPEPVSREAVKWKELVEALDNAIKGTWYSFNLPDEPTAQSARHACYKYGSNNDAKVATAIRENGSEGYTFWFVKS